MNDKNPIEIIFLSPKQYLGYYEYIVNDGECHTKKNEELIEYLKNISPSLLKEIIDFINLRKSFFILPKDNFIEELKFDLENEQKIFKKNLRSKNFSIKNTLRQKEIVKKHNFEFQDLIIKSISKKNIY